MPIKLLAALLKKREGRRLRARIVSWQPERRPQWCAAADWRKTQLSLCTVKFLYHNEELVL